MDPNNIVKYRFIPGRRRAPRLNGQRQLTGREIVAIRQRHHQQRNLQPELQHQGRRRQVEQELLEGGVQVPIPRRPIGRLPVAGPAPERPPRPRRPAPPMFENPAVEVPFLLPQPEDEQMVPDHPGHGGWRVQPNVFEQLQNAWPEEFPHPEQEVPERHFHHDWHAAYGQHEPFAPEGAQLYRFNHQPRDLEVMDRNPWPAEFWDQGYPEPLPVEPGQQREGNQQQADGMAQLGDNVQPQEVQVPQLNQAAACCNRCGRPCDQCMGLNEGVQRPEQEAAPPQEEGQAPRNPPAQLNSGPAESDAAHVPRSRGWNQESFKQ